MNKLINFIDAGQLDDESLKKFKDLNQKLKD